MNTTCKSLPATDITLGDLLATVAHAPDLPLVFVYDGHPVRPSYHVTEVKAGHFSALDCGANPEAWSEIFVQLWDMEEGGRRHMTAGKFATIVRKVSDHVQLDDDAKLTFEVSDGFRPMQLYCAATPRVSAGSWQVELVPRSSSCKPRDRWLDMAETSACCSPSSEGAACCA